MVSWSDLPFLCEIGENLVACCTGQVFIEIISLAPKLCDSCEMYATILLKLFLNCHQHIIEVNGNVGFILLLVNS